jgi:hypothetical protein
MFLISWSVFPTKYFQPSLIFVSKAVDYLTEAPFKGALLQGRLLALPKIIALGWKGLPGTNILAYYIHNECTLKDLKYWLELP